jgi:hypothetical protein
MKAISNESFTELLRVLETFMALSFSVKMALKEVLYERTYEKDARILNFGDTQQVVWFLMEGLLREIRMNQKTLKEKTSWFWPAGNFSYTDPGFFSQQPSERAIEASQPCKVIFISYPDWSALKSELEEIEVITEMIRGMYNKMKIEHVEDMKLLSIQERYLDKEEILDCLFPRTQLNYIADYMGMAADTLGRLRAKYYGRRR